MKSRRRLTVFAITAMSVVVIGLSVAWMLARPGYATTGVGRSFGVGAWGDPVLVVVVGSREAVESVRAVVDPSRVVAESAEAFAVRERRLIAATTDSVGPVLMVAGWMDAELEILALSRGLRARPGSSSSEGEDGEARLAELIAKPSLTLWEARRFLESMP